MRSIQTTTLNAGYVKQNNTPVSLSLSLNQVVPIEKQYPVWENLWTTFNLVGWRKITWAVEVSDASDWWESLWTQTILTTEIFVDPVDADNLNSWEFYINYTTWECKAKGLLPGWVIFKYLVDNSVSVTSASEDTARYDYDTNWRLVYEGYAEVWSLESASVWNVRKYFYTDIVDAPDSVSKILFSNWSLARNVAWDDRETLTYS